MRESKKKKKKPMLMRLVSTAGTGFFYVVDKTMKRKRNDVKLELRKYDPRVKRHVLFTEEKMKR